MSKRIGVFVDVSNLYYCLGKRFKNHKLDYQKYIEFVEDLGTITQLIAYGAQIKNKAGSFIHCLRKLGFKTKYKQPKTFNNPDKIRRKADWDVGIAIDIVQQIDRLDMIVLGTADGDLEPLVKWAVDKGVDVIILACGISRDLKESATDYFEIMGSMLEQESDDEIIDSSG